MEETDQEEEEEEEEEEEGGGGGGGGHHSYLHHQHYHDHHQRHHQSPSPKRDTAQIQRPHQSSRQSSLGPHERQRSHQSPRQSSLGPRYHKTSALRAKRLRRAHPIRPASTPQLALALQPTSPTPSPLHTTIAASLHVGSLRPRPQAAIVLAPAWSSDRIQHTRASVRHDLLFDERDRLHPSQSLRVRVDGVRLALLVRRRRLQIGASTVVGLCFRPQPLPRDGGAQLLRLGGACRPPAPSSYRPRWAAAASS